MFCTVFCPLYILLSVNNKQLPQAALEAAVIQTYFLEKTIKIIDLDDVMNIDTTAFGFLDVSGTSTTGTKDQWLFQPWLMTEQNGVGAYSSTPAHLVMSYVDTP